MSLLLFYTFYHCRSSSRLSRTIGFRLFFLFLVRLNQLGSKAPTSLPSETVLLAE